MSEKNLLIGAAVIIGITAYIVLRKSPRELTNSIMSNGGRSDEAFERKMIIQPVRNLRKYEKVCRQNPDKCKELTANLFK
jgi:hypothetical protein